MGFGYVIVKTYPLTILKKHKNHRRLSVFFYKGVKCVSCNRKGHFIGLGVDKNGGTHLDVYCKDGHPMTVDHIQPVSKGGNDLLENKQPMCQECNSKKGNKYEEISKNVSLGG